MFESRRALVVAAHPDDEVLGCGGTVARLVGAGADVRTLILATGALSRAAGTSVDAAALRQAAQDAATVLGVTKVDFGGFPDNAMDSVPLIEIIRKIERVVEDFGPDLVLTHHAGDLNIDHRISHEAVLTACRPLPVAEVRTILAFETASATEWQSTARQSFAPTAFVDISRQLETKIAALSHYAAEMQPSPHPRNIEHIVDLAHVWGRKTGVEAAEPFEVVRHLVT